MTNVVKQVLTTVNAPYGANLSANQLASKIIDPKNVDLCDASVFAFFSDVNPVLQESFIELMGLDKTKVQQVARQLSAKAGFPLALAA